MGQLDCVGLHCPTGNACENDERSTARDINLDIHRRAAWVTLLLALNASGSDEVIGTFADWNTTRYDSGAVIAKTANDAGSTLGLMCTSSDTPCSAWLNVMTKCTANEQQVFLMSSAIGSTALTASCLAVGDADSHYIEVFDPKDLDSILSGLSSGSPVGFAASLKGGEFAVERFSTAGAVAAVRAAKASVDAANTRQPRPQAPVKQQGKKAHEIL
jgi:hypothetical protein